MGVIVKRTDNQSKATYQVRIRKKGFPALSKHFTARSEAEEWLHSNEASMNRGAHTCLRSANELTLSDLINRYVTEVSPHKKGAATEIIRLKAIQKHDIAQYAVANVSGMVMGRWRDKRLESVSGSTVNRELGMLGHVFETARKEWGVAIVVNPVQAIRRPKSNPPRERRLGEDEEKALLAASQRSRIDYLRPVIQLALETAMRQAELVSIEWGQVNIAQRRIHLLKTKNGSTRGVPLSRKAIEVLEGLPTRAGPLFPGVTPEAVKRSFRRTCEAANVPDFHFHDLRHEATSRLFEKGLNVMEVASITGHKSLTMLMRYTHLDAGKLANRLD